MNERRIPEPGEDEGVERLLGLIAGTAEKALAITPAPTSLSTSAYTRLYAVMNTLKADAQKAMVRVLEDRWDLETLAGEMAAAQTFAESGSMGPPDEARPCACTPGEWAVRIRAMLFRPPSTPVVVRDPLQKRPTWFFSMEMDDDATACLGDDVPHVLRCIRDQIEGDMTLLDDGDVATYQLKRVDMSDVEVEALPEI